MIPSPKIKLHSSISPVYNLLNDLNYNKNDILTATRVRFIAKAHRLIFILKFSQRERKKGEEKHQTLYILKLNLKLRNLIARLKTERKCFCLR